MNFTFPIILAQNEAALYPVSKFFAKPFLFLIKDYLSNLYNYKNL